MCNALRYQVIDTEYWGSSSDTLPAAVTVDAFEDVFWF